MDNNRIILGVTGASGVIMSIYVAEALKNLEAEIHLIVSDAARRTWKCEVDRPIEDLTKIADVVYDVNNMAAAVASGTFGTTGMIIMPCSMKTLAGITTGYADNLILRAADVCLKENRRVILCPREMPLSRLHLKNLNMAAELGCCIIPPMMSFYGGQTSMEDQINHVVGKILMQFGLEYEKFYRWNGKV